MHLKFVDFRITNPSLEKVKDPNLVGSLSGHKEGSKAFARYRDIYEDMKKELVSLLD